jgi:predicted ATPase/signal transduction histidine kinase
MTPPIPTPPSPIPLPPGYELREILHESPRTLVYRALHPTLHQPVVLKLAHPHTADPATNGRLQREYQIISNLPPGALQAHELLTYNQAPILILQDINGRSLRQQLNNQPLPPTTFLPLAIAICQQLILIHQQHLIHKDLNPANIIWNPQTNQVQIIDFGLSTTLAQEIPEARQTFEGTLPYISPEQTGRINRTIDYRTDFYALGVTFYQLLTGILPFQADDPLELIHAHIARQPQPPHILQPAIPLPLSAIILRLMAKNAEDRYQSAYGLKADLEWCYQQWQENGRIPPLTLGQHDIASQFQLPQKLYGREAEISTLLHTFQRISQPDQHNVELLLVTGPAGIGKSSLVQEIHKPVIIQRGYYISGKFDQLHRTPYAALIEAFQTLIRQLLTENATRIEQWRQRLLLALGSNAQILIEAIPALERIIGPQPAVPELPPLEAENRFTLTMQNFVHAITDTGSPLVIFLDDWQWMDASSRELLQRLITMPHTRHLLIIGAYRDNELPEGHPVWLTLKEIEAQAVPISHLHLQPLSQPTIAQYLADTLHSDTAVTHPLALLLETKTGGNPFFLNEFLKSLVRASIISFNASNGRWQWNMAHIQAAPITDNILDLMMTNIQKLDATAQNSIKLAACIGSRFTLDTLALAAATTPTEAAHQLWPAIQQGLILPLNDAYKFAAYTPMPHITYKFAHDRIQQAAYDLIPLAEKQQIHYRIGQHLLQATTNPNATESETSLFTIANHLNLGHIHAQTSAEIEQIIRLNLDAGRKALTSAAYHPALEYLQTGLNLLSPQQRQSWWQSHYDLMLALTTTAVQAAYLSGQYPLMNELATAAHQNGRTLLDQIPVYETRIQAHVAQNELTQAVEIALTLLPQLGLKIPTQPTRRHILLAYLQTRRLLRGHTRATLLQRPHMTDPTQIAITQLLSNCGVAAYFLSAELFALIILHLVQRYVTYGYTVLAPRAIASYGLMLCGAFNDIDSGYEMGQTALALVNQLNANETRGATMFVVHEFISHTKRPLREGMAELQRGYQLALEAGDPEFAMFCAYAYSSQAVFSGLDLRQLVPEIEQYTQMMLYHKQEKVLYIQQLFQQTAVNLFIPSSQPTELIGPHYDEAVIVPQYHQAQDTSSLCAYYVQKAILLYLFNDAPAARQFLTLAEPLLPSIVGSNLVAHHHLFAALATLACYPQLTAAEQKKARQQAHRSRQKLQRLAQHGPANYGWMPPLIQAELARVQQQPQEAAAAYEEAIEQVYNTHFVNFEALTWELAAKFYATQGNGRLFNYALTQAHTGYTRWGAYNKVHHLEAAYPSLSNASSSQTANIPPTTTATIATIASTYLQPGKATLFGRSGLLDVAGVIQASQALSSQTELTKVQQLIMEMVQNQSGVHKVYLLQEQHGDWQIITYHGHQADKHDLLPHTVLAHVAQTREILLLDDPLTDGRFAQDLVLQHRAPQSLACLPLLNLGNLVGLLYLENEEPFGVITAVQLSMLNLLTSQAAISLENAQLYGRLNSYNRELEAKVANRTQELAQATRQAEDARATAEQAIAAKSAFLANMSHELRTPLNAIIGFTRIVRRRGEPYLEAKQQENLDKVLLSAENLLAIINIILDIAKIEANRLEVQTAHFNLATVVTMCLYSLQSQLCPGVTLHNHIPDNLPLIYSDQEKVRHLLFNILENAHKFTHEGSITIQAEQPTPTTIAIHISDTGIGMEPSAIPRIFDEFQQANSTIRQQYGGVGLGLAMSRSLARLLGGSITAVSAPNTGATFTVTLPIHYSMKQPKVEDSNR